MSFDLQQKQNQKNEKDKNEKIKKKKKKKKYPAGDLSVLLEEILNFLVRGGGVQVLDVHVGEVFGVLREGEGRGRGREG